MRRFAVLPLLVLTACTGGGNPSSPAVVREAPPTPAPTASPPAELPPEISPLPTPPSLATLAGVVTYLSRIALTPEALVQVELRDVTMPDLDTPPIAKQVIQRPGQVPVAFELSYEPGALVPGHRYALSARISDRGQLQFVTENPVAAIPRGAPVPIEILVTPVR